MLGDAVDSLLPILTTRDLRAALGFYRDLLGGTVTYEFPGPDGEPGYVEDYDVVIIGQR